MLYIYNPQYSRAFETKRRRIIGAISNDCHVILNCKNDFKSFEAWASCHSMKFRKVSLLSCLDIRFGDSIIFDPRQKIDLPIVDYLFSNFTNIFLSTNHFFILNKDIIDYIVKFNHKIIYIIENFSSKKTICQRFGLDEEGVKVIIIYPGFPESDFVEPSVFKEIISAHFIRRSINFLTGGAIFIHKKSDSIWWQKLFSTNEYFPARTVLHKFAKRTGEVKSFSLVLDDDSSELFIPKLLRYIKIKLGIVFLQYKRYYSRNIIKDFNDSNFFFCPPDIFSIIPELGFQAMRHGCILIGDDSNAYLESGFIDGVNYISIGKAWNNHSIRFVIDRVNKMSDSDILKLRLASLSLYAQISSISNKSISMLQG